MALDYGRRRIGVALSDPTRTIASPSGTIERPRGQKKPTPVPPDLLRLVTESETSAILVGIPFAMDGSVGEMAREARAFAEAVGQATGLPTIEWDERLTTARAEREIRSMELPKSKRRAKGRMDEMAAALMLSDYLRSPGAQTPLPFP